MVQNIVFGLTVVAAIAAGVVTAINEIGPRRKSSDEKNETSEK